MSLAVSRLPKGLTLAVEVGLRGQAAVTKLRGPREKFHPDRQD